MDERIKNNQWDCRKYIENVLFITHSRLLTSHSFTHTIYGDVCMSNGDICIIIVIGARCKLFLCSPFLYSSTTFHFLIRSLHIVAHESSSNSILSPLRQPPIRILIRICKWSSLKKKAVWNDEKLPSIVSFFSFRRAVVVRFSYTHRQISVNAPRILCSRSIYSETLSTIILPFLLISFHQLSLF